jgi:hypothetical protein
VAEVVPASDADVGLDGVSELAQPIDVATHGADGDVQTCGELRSRPRATRLQRREHGKEAGNGVEHAVHRCTNEDKFVPASAVRSN